MTQLELPLEQNQQLTADEKAAQVAFFQLAEKFYRFMVHKIDGLPGMPFPPGYSDAIKRAALMQEVAYSNKSVSERTRDTDLFELTAVFAADLLHIAIDHLSQSEIYEEVRILAHMPVSEDDVPEEALRQRLDAIQRLVAEGGRTQFAEEVIAYADSLYENSRDGYQDSVREALTVSRK